MILRVLLAIMLFGGLPAFIRAQPSLSYAVPGAIQPGQTTELTLHGAKLDRSLAVWSSIPGRFEVAPGEEGKQDVASRVCRVTLDAQVPVGLGGLVVANESGSSDVLFVMIDDLPSVLDNGSNHAVGSAQRIALPTAVDGVANGREADYYQFAAKKGQRLSVEVVAARAASPLDSVVRLLRSDGSELLLADDDPSLGADSRFAFSLPDDGEYVIEIRDNRYRDGGRYRLRLGDFPLVSAAYPMGGRYGSTVRFQFTGPLVESAAPVFMRLPEHAGAGPLSLATRFPGGKSSGMATIVTSRLPDIVESEPNNDLGTATLTSLPCAVNGTFQHRGDRDFFQFAATKGQAMEFQALSRSMGSPSYLLIRLYNAEGKQVAESPINDADETSLAYTFPADGMYQLMVEDLLQRGGPEFGYRVEVEPNNGFSLAMKHDNSARTRVGLAKNGGAFAVTVQISRRAYAGPIEFQLADSSLGFLIYDAIAPEKAKEHRLVIAVPPGASPGALHALRLVGSATIDGREYRAAVQTSPTLRARMPQLAFPPGWLDGLLVASVTGESPPLVSLASSASPIVFSRAQAQAQFNVKLERKNDAFKDPVTMWVQGLPAGFAAAVKPDKDLYQVTITGPKNAASGKHAVKLSAYGELKGAGQIVSTDVPLDVTD
jgi:hypothetical protein